MTDGFEIKQNGDVFDVRCRKCGGRWRNDQGDWLAKVLEHARQHFQKRRNAIAPEPVTKA